MNRSMLILIAIMFFAFICTNGNFAGGEVQSQVETNDNTITNTDTDLALLQSADSSVSQSDNDNALQGVMNQLSDTMQTAESSLDDLFKNVDETQGVAQKQDMPDPISYPQQSANQLTGQRKSQLAPAEAAGEVVSPVESAPVDSAPVDSAPVEAAPVESAPVEAAPEVPAPEVAEPISILGYDSSDNMFSLGENVASNDKLKPNELLPKGEINMTDKNFLTSTITDTTTRVGTTTQLNRNRKNYDLRSTPVIEKKQVSPWNISTDEPDTKRRQFEIGSSDCPPCPASQDNNI